MIEYKLKNGDILKDGHTMFLEDVVKDLERKAFLEIKPLPEEVEQALEALEKLAVIYENDCEDPELGKPHWLRHALITCQHLRNKGE